MWRHVWQSQSRSPGWRHPSQGDGYDGDGQGSGFGTARWRSHLEARRRRRKFWPFLLSFGYIGGGKRWYNGVRVSCQKEDPVLKSPETTHVAVAPPALLTVGTSAASCWCCCFGCCGTRASSLAAVLLARTTARQLLERARATHWPVDHDALAVFAWRVLRVSATFRRGAAAYGVASRCFSKARTHRSLLV